MSLQRGGLGVGRDAPSDEQGVVVGKLPNTSAAGVPDGLTRSESAELVEAFAQVTLAADAGVCLADVDNSFTGHPQPVELSDGDRGVFAFEVSGGRLGEESWRVVGGAHDDINPWMRRDVRSGQGGEGNPAAEAAEVNGAGHVEVPLRSLNPSMQPFSTCRLRVWYLFSPGSTAVRVRQLQAVSASV